jgi:hypothetical protein
MAGRLGRGAQALQGAAREELKAARPVTPPAAGARRANGARAREASLFLPGRPRGPGDAVHACRLRESETTPRVVVGKACTAARARTAGAEQW